MIFFFDFDGTIIDVKDKYYQIYLQFIKENNGKPLEINDFWSFKRQMKSNEELCQLSGINPSLGVVFKTFTKNNIEKEEFLRFDRLIDGVEEVFNTITAQKIGEINIISMRRNEISFKNQLNNLKISRFVNESYLPNTMDKIFEDGDPLAKSIAITALQLHSKKAVLIGDTGTDMKSGRALSWITIGVLSGLRDRNQLQLYNPHYILDSVKDILPIFYK